MVTEKENPSRSPAIHQMASEREKRFLWTPLRIVSGLYRFSDGGAAHTSSYRLTRTNSKLLERYSCVHVEVGLVCKLSYIKQNIGRLIVIIKIVTQETQKLEKCAITCHSAQLH